MIREIIMPTSNTYTLTLPNDLIGKEVEVIAFALNTDNTLDVVKDKRLAKKELDNFYNTINLDFSDFKFNRDAANQR